MYVGVEFEDYCRWRAWNASLMKQGDPETGGSMRHVAHTINSPPKPESDSMRLGTLAHAFLLEHDRVAPLLSEFPGKWIKSREEYDMVGPDTVAFREFAAAATAEGRIPFHPFDMPKLRGILKAAREDRDMSRMLEAKSDREVGLVWDVGNEDGTLGRHVPESFTLRHKARIDLAVFSDTFGFQNDVKTCGYGWGERAFARAIVNYGYDITAALYREGQLATQGYSSPTFISWFTTEAPFLCEVVELSDQWFRYGRRRLHELRRRIARCIWSNDWDESWQRGNGPRLLFPPEYYVRRFEGA